MGHDSPRSHSRLISDEMIRSVGRSTLNLTVDSLYTVGLKKCQMLVQFAMGKGVGGSNDQDMA